MFDKINGMIRVYDGTRYLILFGSEKYDLIYSRIRYLIGVRSGIHMILYLQGKKKTFYNVVILIKSVWNKDKKNYYYNMYLEKASYELPKK